MTGAHGPCAQCGGTPEAGETCQDRFHELLIFDFRDPAYGVVHHLLVLSFMTQHADQLTDEGFAFNRRLLSSFAADQLPASHLQQRALGLRSARDAFEGPARVIRRPALPRIRIPWSRTVFDVDFSDGPAYGRTVEDWARSIAHDLDTHLGHSEPTTGDQAGRY